MAVAKMAEELTAPHDEQQARHLSFDNELLDLQKRQTRIMEAYEKGAYTVDDYTRRITPLREAEAGLKSEYPRPPESLTKRYSRQTSASAGIHCPRSCLQPSLPSQRTKQMLTRFIKCVWIEPAKGLSCTVSRCPRTPNDPERPNWYWLSTSQYHLPFVWPRTSGDRPGFDFLALRNTVEAPQAAGMVHATAPGSHPEKGTQAPERRGTPRVDDSRRKAGKARGWKRTCLQTQADPYGPLARARRTSRSAPAAPSTQSNANPNTNGPVIIAVSTKASGSTPATVTPKTRTKSRNKTATSKTPPKESPTRRAHERRFKTTPSGQLRQIEQRIPEGEKRRKTGPADSPLRETPRTPATMGETNPHDPNAPETSKTESTCS